MKPETFDKLKGLVVQHFNNASRIYVFDGYAGSSPASRRKVVLSIIFLFFIFLTFFVDSS